MTNESGLFYSRIFLRNARAEIERLIDELTMADSDAEETMRARLSEILSLMSKTWHVRNLSQAEFEALSHSNMDWIRHAIPDLGFGSKSFHIVPINASIDGSRRT